MNNLENFVNVFDSIEPFDGRVPNGYSSNFLGTLTDHQFFADVAADEQSGVSYASGVPPTLEDGEAWFEAVNWHEAAHQANNLFVMATLGANWGAQAVNAYRMLRLVNPMPCKLIAVEPVPQNYEWLKKHLVDNTIDPNQHWLLPAALSFDNAPVFFPIGSPGSGAQNCYSTNELAARQEYVRRLVAHDPRSSLEDLILHHTTNIVTELAPEKDLPGEIKLISAITLKDILGPFELVDYIEADLQQSEILVFPPYIDILRRKVRRIHIGTHGRDVHQELHNLFSDGGWEIIFSYEPNTKFATTLGVFKTNDGVLTVRNPDL